MARPLVWFQRLTGGWTSRLWRTVRKFCSLTECCWWKIIINRKFRYLHHHQSDILYWQRNLHIFSSSASQARGSTTCQPFESGPRAWVQYSIFIILQLVGGRGHRPASSYRVLAVGWKYVENGPIYTLNKALQPVSNSAYRLLFRHLHFWVDNCVLCTLLCSSIYLFL